MKLEDIKWPLKVNLEDSNPAVCAIYDANNTHTGIVAWTKDEELLRKTAGALNDKYYDSKKKEKRPPPEEFITILERSYWEAIYQKNVGMTWEQVQKSDTHMPKIWAASVKKSTRKIFHRQQENGLDLVPCSQLAEPNMRAEYKDIRTERAELDQAIVQDPTVVLIEKLSDRVVFIAAPVGNKVHRYWVMINDSGTLDFIKERGSHEYKSNQPEVTDSGPSGGVEGDSKGGSEVTEDTATTQQAAK